MWAVHLSESRGPNLVNWLSYDDYDHDDYDHDADYDDNDGEDDD